MSMLKIYFFITMYCVCHAAFFLSSKGSDTLKDDSSTTHEKETGNSNKDDPHSYKNTNGSLNATQGSDFILRSRRSSYSWTNCQPCGVALNTRIVGGTEASISEFPWMVSLWAGNNFRCGGSILNRNYVLTAAHCIEKFNPTDITVYAGVANKQDANGFLSSVEYGIMHQNYQGAEYSLDYDVAILKLAKGIPFEKGITPICLPTENVNLDGQMGVATGWGVHIEYTDSAPDQLQKITIPIVSNEECQREQCIQYTTITERMICAADLKAEKGEGKGDSGGPLVWNNNGVFTQVGIVSWGPLCSHLSYGVYTRVTSVMDWITQNVPQQSC